MRRANLGTTRLKDVRRRNPASVRVGGYDLGARVDRFLRYVAVHIGIAVDAVRLFWHVVPIHRRLAAFSEYFGGQQNLFLRRQRILYAGSTQDPNDEQVASAAWASGEGHVWVWVRNTLGVTRGAASGRTRADFSLVCETTGHACAGSLANDPGGQPLLNPFHNQTDIALTRWQNGATYILAFMGLWFGLRLPGDKEQRTQALLAYWLHYPSSPLWASSCQMNKQVAKHYI